MVETIRKLLHLLSRRQKWQTAGLFVLMVVGSLLEIVGVGSIPAFVSLLGEPERLDRFAVVQRTKDLLAIEGQREFVLWCAGGLVLFFVLKNLFFAFLAYHRARFTHGTGVAIADRLFRAYVRSPYTFHLQRNTAQILRNVYRESKNVIEMVLMPVLTLLLEVLILVGIFVLLITAAPAVSFGAFGGLSLTSGLLYLLLRRRLRVHGIRSQEFEGKMIQSVNEGLGGVKLTQILGRGSYFEKRFHDNAVAHAQASVFRTAAADLPRLIVETTAVAALLVISITFVARDLPLSEIIPLLTLFAVATVRLVPSFNRVSMALNTMRFGQVAIDVVNDDLRALEGTPAPTADPRLLPLDVAIMMEDVHYRYDGTSEDALAAISLEIPHGSAVAFVGPSGAGKTTVVNVLLGLLEPTAGSVQADGVDIHRNLRGWQRQIGYVPQETYLTDSTIRRNVAFGITDEEIDEAAVRRAIRSAQLESLVQRLPAGLDTIVGEDGLRLSGGQRQRIGIARALYDDPQVLIMDEPTSDLDTETERRILKAVEALRGDRTVIVVAHRISTVRDCDRLFFLRDGRLEASGTYQELLETSSGFRAIAVV